MPRATRRPRPAPAAALWLAGWPTAAACLVALAAALQPGPARGLCLAIIDAALGERSAAAQPLALTSPTRGPEIPLPTLAGDPEATAAVLAAANLGFLRSWSAVGLYTWVPEAALRGPSGGGLYGALPLPIIDQVVLGAGLELVRPSAEFASGDAGKLSLALAARLLPSLSLGVTYSHLFAGTAGDKDTVDLSVAARLGRFLALTAVVHDLAEPLDRGTPIERVYQGELALRPLGDARFELGLSAQVGERRGEVEPALRLQLSLARGLWLRGGVEYVRDLGNGGGPNQLLRGTAGLVFDLARFGFAIHGLAGTLGDGTAGGQLQGLSAAVRLSGERYPSLPRPRRFERVDLAGAATAPRALPRLLERLRRLEGEARVDGIVAVMGELEGSWATMEELRGAFRRLRAAGKHVVVFAAELSTKGYYAAAAAERILLDPGGGLRFLGVQTQAFYLKGTLDKLGVVADFVKIAEYKSAPEQFTRSESSPEAQQVRAALLDDIDVRVRAAVAADRRLDPARVTALRDGGPLSAAAALAAGLVDEVRGGDEVEASLARLVGGRRVEVAAAERAPERPLSFAAPALAVLFIDGDIVEGRSRVLPLSIPFLGSRVSGHETVIAAINAARSDERVRALVVRVESPGGSALASDLIARELARTRAVKPVICSFGDTAASGGYWVAAGCDTTLAQPSSITGSIGIFSGKADLSGLATRLGVAVELGGRGAHADMDSWFRPYTDEERELILGRLRASYQRFVEAVARGRALGAEQVEAVARGRVWTGAQARERRLVDTLGGLAEALQLAAERAHLSPRAEREMIVLPDEPSTLLGLLAQLVGLRTAGSPGPAVAEAIPAALRALAGAVPASLLLGPSTPQARLPFQLGD